MSAPGLPKAMLLVWSIWLLAAGAMRADHITALRRESVEMFYHGFDNYMRVAFPEDEVRVLCPEYSTGAWCCIAANRLRSSAPSPAPLLPETERTRVTSVSTTCSATTRSR